MEGDRVALLVEDLWRVTDGETNGETVARKMWRQNVAAVARDGWRDEWRNCGAKMWRQNMARKMWRQNVAAKCGVKMKRMAEC